MISLPTSFDNFIMSSHNFTWFSTIDFTISDRPNVKLSPLFFKFNVTLSLNEDNKNFYPMACVQDDWQH